MMQCSCFSNILTVLHQEIAMLCHEKTQVQKAQHKFRHCLRDERHEAWDMKLKTIEERKKILVERRMTILLKKCIMANRCPCRLPS